MDTKRRRNREEPERRSRLQWIGDTLSLIDLVEILVWVPRALWYAVRFLWALLPWT